MKEQKPHAVQESLSGFFGDPFLDLFRNALGSSFSAHVFGMVWIGGHWFDELTEEVLSARRELLN